MTSFFHFKFTFSLCFVALLSLSLSLSFFLSVSLPFGPLWANMYSTHFEYLFQSLLCTDFPFLLLLLLQLFLRTQLFTNLDVVFTRILISFSVFLCFFIFIVFLLCVPFSGELCVSGHLVLHQTHLLTYSLTHSSLPNRINNKRSVQAHIEIG